MCFPNDLSPLLLSLFFFLTKAAVVLAETVNKISPGTLDLEEVWRQAFGAVARSWHIEAGGSVSLLAETLWGISGENGDQSLAWRLWGRRAVCYRLNLFQRLAQGMASFLRSPA